MSPLVTGLQPVLCVNKPSPANTILFSYETFQIEPMHENTKMTQSTVSHRTSGKTPILALIDFYINLTEAVSCSDDTTERTGDSQIKRSFPGYVTFDITQSHAESEFKGKLMQRSNIFTLDNTSKNFEA